MEKQKDETKKLLGIRIKELRKKRGFTQDRLAEEINVDPKHLSRIECGSNFPSLDLLNKIAIALGISPDQLFVTVHLKDKQTLIKEIEVILRKESIENIRSYYKILMGIVN